LGPPFAVGLSNGLPAGGTQAGDPGEIECVVIGKLDGASGAGAGAARRDGDGLASQIEEIRWAGRFGTDRIQTSNVEDQVVVCGRIVDFEFAMCAKEADSQGLAEELRTTAHQNRGT